MTRMRSRRVPPPRPILAILSCIALAAASVAVAQSDDLVDSVTFESEMARVDLYRNDAGEIVERLVPVDEAVPGDEIEYRITATNDGDRIYRARQFGANNPIPDGVEYVEGSAGAEDANVLVEFSSDGGTTYAEAPLTVDGEVVPPAQYDAIQWTYLERFEPGDAITFTYRVTVL